MAKLKDKSVGVVYGGDKVNGDRGDCVASVDGITFGVLSGQAFDTSRNESWDRVRWARANSLFFRRMAADLEQYAQAVEDGKFISRLPFEAKI